MRALFKDEQKQRQFERDGYAVLSFLDEDEARDLVERYHAIDHGEITDSLYVSSNTARGRDFVRTVHDVVKGAVAARVGEHFLDCRIITASYLVKKPNPRNRVLPHQDWTTVDETRYACASIWTALADIPRERGALGTLRGSHRFFSQVLCSPSAYSYRKLPYAAHLATIFPYMAFHALRAGEALVFDTRTIHGSLANTTTEMRMAAGIGIVPAEATLYHHYLLPESNAEEFETYEVGEDFFWTYNNVTLTDLHKEGKKPEGLKSLGVSRLSDFTAAPLSAEAMIDRITSAGNVLDPTVASAAGGAIFGRS
jgi:ectoine hydroxylase-related dioxygenase (phytanoyl-CoA dioxygenase family)